MDVAAYRIYLYADVTLAYTSRIRRDPIIGGDVRSAPYIYVQSTVPP